MLVQTHSEASDSRWRHEAWESADNTTAEEVEEEQLTDMFCKKAADGAGLVAEMIKCGSHTLIELIAEVLNDV